MSENNLNVLHISTSINATSACTRLHFALLRVGVNSKIITKKINGEISQAYLLRCNRQSRVLYIYKKIIESLIIRLIYCKRERNMPFSCGLSGYDISEYLLVKEADIIHIHWVSNFQSIYSINKLINLDKPIVISMHDNWMITGGCHVRMGCERYKDECGNCPILLSKNLDFSKWLLKKKKKLLLRNNVTVISPSRWMDGNICGSFLKNNRHYVIGNAIDVDIYKQYNNYSRNERKIKILFGAINAIDTPYKGYKYLKRTVEILYKKKINVEIYTFGIDKEKEISILGQEVFNYGYISDERKMAQIYGSVDIYVVPSLEDSFNQTVAECMACETPVAAFATGGIIDIIDHKKNGYLAEYKNADDLANGIIWINENNHNNIIGKCARKKIIEQYSYDVIGKKMKEMYQNIISEEK